MGLAPENSSCYLSSLYCVFLYTVRSVVFVLRRGVQKMTPEVQTLVLLFSFELKYGSN